MKVFDVFKGFNIENFMSKNLSISTRAVFNLKKENPAKYEREAIGAMATSMGFTADDFYKNIFCVHNNSDTLSKAFKVSNLANQLINEVNNKASSYFRGTSETLTAHCRFLNDSFYAASNPYEIFSENSIEFKENIDLLQIDVFKRNPINRFFAPNEPDATFSINKENGECKTKSEIYDEIRICFKQYKVIAPTIYRNDIKLRLVINPKKSNEPEELKELTFSSMVGGKNVRLDFKINRELNLICTYFKFGKIEYSKDETDIFDLMEDLIKDSKSKELENLFNALSYESDTSDISAFEKDSKIYNFFLNTLLEPQKKLNIHKQVSNNLNKTMDILVSNIIDCLAPGIYTGCIQMLAKYADENYKMHSLVLIFNKGTVSFWLPNSSFFKNAKKIDKVTYEIETNISSKNEFYESQIIRNDFYTTI